MKYNNHLQINTGWKYYIKKKNIAGLASVPSFQTFRKGRKWIWEVIPRG